MKFFKNLTTTYAIAKVDTMLSRMLLAGCLKSTLFLSQKLIVLYLTIYVVYTSMNHPIKMCANQLKLITWIELCVPAEYAKLPLILPYLYIYIKIS